MILLEEEILVFLGNLLTDPLTFRVCITDHICKIFISYPAPSETKLMLDTRPSQVPATSASISSVFTSINSSMNFEILEICCAYRVIKDQPSPKYCLFISAIKIPLHLVSEKKDSVWKLRGISRRQKKTVVLQFLFFLELVNSEEWGLQDFFQFLWLKEILREKSLSH